MEAQQEHNPGGYYLLQDWRGYSLLTCRSLADMRRSKHNYPEFTTNLATAAWFPTLEDAHAAFRDCHARLRLTTMPPDYSFRSVSCEEAVHYLIGEILTH